MDDSFGAILALIIIIVIFYELIFKNSKLLLKIKSLKNKKNNNVIIEKENNNESTHEDKRVVITSIKDLPPKEVKEEEKIIEEVKEYIKPQINMLSKSKKEAIDQSIIDEKINIINDTLKSFKIKAKVCNTDIGAQVSVFEVELLGNTKIEKIVDIQDELKVSLGTKNLILLIPVPGKSTIGIEIPNNKMNMVSLREVISNIPNNYKESKILVPLGLNPFGNYRFADLTKYQQLLVTGGFSSGKTSFLNSVIVSNLIMSTPNDLKLVLIDSEKSEFSIYDGLKNLMCPVITDYKKAIDYLIHVVEIIKERQETLYKFKTPNIEEYNKRYSKFNNHMEHILVIINSYYDIYLFNDCVQELINKIIYDGRECGVNIILSANNNHYKTQEVLSELDFNSIVLFKSRENFISNKVKDNNVLLGSGDAFYKLFGDSEEERIQTPYVEYEDIKRIVSFLKEKNGINKTDS